MQVSALPNISRVVLAGSFAKEFLDAPGKARIISVFRRSLYVENTSGRIVCIGARDIGPGPLNALCEFSGDVDFKKQMLSSVDALVANGFVRLGQGVGLDTSQIEEWKPEPFPVFRDFESLLCNLSFVAAWIDDRGPREGLAPLVPHIIRCEDLSSDDVFRQIAWKAISELGNWLSRRLSGRASLDFSSVDNQLVGLGPGLTPSGDDFWCGVMIALSALGRFDVLGEVGTTLLQQARARTNKISCAHLECAANGQGAHALHEVLAAITTKGEHLVGRALRVLGRIGHTSGWDSLAGLVCVLMCMPSLLQCRRVST